MNRTMERPSDVGVRVATWNDTYAEDFKRINLEWIGEYFQIEESDREQLGDPRGDIEMTLELAEQA